MKILNSLALCGLLMFGLFFCGCGKAVEDSPVVKMDVEGFETDTIRTSMGDLHITFIGHGTLMMRWGGKVIHIDPWTRLTDYSNLPKADLILITHDHRDHLDPEAIEQVRKADTVIIAAKACANTFSPEQIMENGQSRQTIGIAIEAVPAYNLVHMRSEGNPYHPRGQGNGYIITFGNRRVYVAGDTENTPEMKALKNIDVAFLPMNLPYTMTPEMVADAARAFRPKILYPYHFGDTDTQKLMDLLKDEKGIEIRIRDLQ